MQSHEEQTDGRSCHQEGGHVAHSRKGGRSYQHLTAEQARQFLHAVRRHPLEALSVLALTTGLRRTDLLALRWLDVSLSEGTVRVSRVPRGALTTEARDTPSLQTDTITLQSHRRMVLTRMALDVLTRHRLQQRAAYERMGRVWEEHDVVFALPTGQPFDAFRDVSIPFKKLLAEAGLPHLRFHDLRHSFALLLLSIGIHPTAVAGMLGYPVVGMTESADERTFLVIQQEAMEKLHHLLDH